MWTLFWDMHSGGGSKEQWEKIYIEAPEAEAKVIFYNSFGHNPKRISCTCCGPDYSITEYKTLKSASAFHRDCPSIGNPKTKSYKYLEPGDKMPAGYDYTSEYEKNKRPVSLAEYIKQKNVLVIRKDKIKPEEKEGDVPTQGYVWVS